MLGLPGDWPLSWNSNLQKLSKHVLVVSAHSHPLLQRHLGIWALCPHRCLSSFLRTSKQQTTVVHLSPVAQILQILFQKELDFV